jgi:hypothetical protein
MIFLHFYNSFRFKYLLALILLSPLFACSGSGGGATGGFNANTPADLSWVAPSEREDGTGLALSEIAGYRIYYGTKTGVYQNYIVINDHTVEQTQIADVPAGTYYVVMTAIDTEGRESDYSSEVVVTV